MQSVVPAVRRFLVSPALTRTALIFVAALWISLLPNLATLNGFIAAGESAGALLQFFFVAGGWLLLIAVLMLSLIIFALPFWGRSVRYVLALAIVAAAILGYFSLFYGTLFDKTMVLNMEQTHTSESLELVSARLLLWTFVIGVLPAIWVLRVKVVPEATRLRALWKPAVVLLVLFTLAAAAIFAQFSRYASAGRNRIFTFHTVAPVNIVAAKVAQVITLRTANIVREPRGTDARIGYPLAKPRLIVMIVGETTRAQNWGLNGYARDTTPKLRAIDGVLNFPDVSSCGTATAISLPCMFSGLTREEFSLSKAAGRETLIDVVQRSGARVFWHDNDGGCKGVCERIDYVDLTNADNPKYCSQKGECVDEILLDGLEAKIRASNKDTLAVLHIKGSHGPAYYKRYPKEFERFTPVCKTSDLASCSREQVVNAYDNTVLYVDHIAAETIAMLKRLDDQFASAMVFASDHGESLGESGIYLHGMPYAVAPKEQTQIPMVAWFSSQFKTMEALDPSCLAAQTKVTRSHDNLYSTLLGLMEIETNEYKRSLDIFESCDGHRTQSAPKK